MDLTDPCLTNFEIISSYVPASIINVKEKIFLDIIVRNNQSGKTINSR
jgi:hypothetical protein